MELDLWSLLADWAFRRKSLKSLFLELFLLDWSLLHRKTSSKFLPERCHLTASTVGSTLYGPQLPSAVHPSPLHTPSCPVSRHTLLCSSRNILPAFCWGWGGDMEIWELSKWTLTRLTGFLSFFFFFKPFSEVLLVPVLEHCEILQHAFGEGNGNPLQYSCLENPWTEEPGRLQSMGSQELDTTWWLNQHHHSINWGALT